MSIALERQVIVTWEDPKEKLPEEGLAVVVSVSGKRKCTRFEEVIYDHALAVAEYWDEEGWILDGIDSDLVLENMVVHAWADIEPYGVSG